MRDLFLNEDICLHQLGRIEDKIIKHFSNSITYVKMSRDNNIKFITSIDVYYRPDQIYPTTTIILIPTENTIGIKQYGNTKPVLYDHKFLKFVTKYMKYVKKYFELIGGRKAHEQN